MKSKAIKGAYDRASGASADRRRGSASEIVRQGERVEEGYSGYAVLVDRKAIDSSGEIVSHFVRTDGTGVAYAPFECVIFPSYADACARCAELMRESANANEGQLEEYPPPEYPRVVYLRLSASDLEIGREGVRHV